MRSVRRHPEFDIDEVVEARHPTSFASDRKAHYRSSLPFEQRAQRRRGKPSGSAIGAALSNSCSALDQLLDILAHQGIRITPVAGAGRINWSVNRSIG